MRKFSSLLTVRGVVFPGGKVQTIYNFVLRIHFDETRICRIIFIEWERMGFITVYGFLFLQWVQHRSRLLHHRKSPTDFLASTAGKGRSVLGYAGVDSTKQLQRWRGGHVHPGDAGWDQGVELLPTIRIP